MKRTIKRKLAWAMAVLACLVVMILALVQVVLSFTNWPRDLVAAQIHTQTGLNAQMDSLRATWGGVTAVHGLRILDNDQQVVLEAGTLEIKHASLLRLALGGDLALAQVRGREVKLHLQEDAAGRWNIQSLMEQVQAATASDEKSDGPLHLPVIALKRMRIEATLSSGKHVLLWPVEMTARQRQGESKTAGPLDVTLKMGDALAASGWVNLTLPFEHHAQVRVTSLAPLASLLEDGRWLDTQASLTWEGRLQKDQLVGQMTIDELRAGQKGSHALVQASGVLGVTAGLDITLTPADLNIRADAWLPGPVTLSQGSLTWADQKITAEALRLKTLDGQIGVQGQYQPDTQQGQAVLNWRDITFPAQIQQQGNANLSLDRQGPLGPLKMTATVESQGKTPWGQWAATVSADANGSSWDQLAWTMHIPSASWQEGQNNYSLTRATAQGQLRGPDIAVSTMTLPFAVPGQGPMQMAGKGNYNLARGTWSFDAQLSSKASSGKMGNASGHVILQGDRESAQGSLDNLELATLAGKITGRVNWGRWQHAAATFDLTAQPPTGEAPLTWQRLGMRGQVEGDISPLNLQLTADVTADKLLASKNAGKKTPSTLPPAEGNPSPPGEDVMAHLSGQVTGNSLTLTSQPVDVLGAKMRLGMKHDFKTGHAVIDVQADRLSLTAVDGLMGRPLHLQGRVNFRVQAALDRFDPTTLDVSGQWSAVDFEHRFVPVTQAHGRLALRQGELALLNIEAESGKGKAAGEIHAKLDQMEKVAVRLMLDHWPVPVPANDFTAALSGHADLTGDLSTQKFQGPAELKINVLRKEAAFVTADIEATLTDDQLDVTKISATVLDGQVTGHAKINLADMNQSTGLIDIQDVDLSHLDSWDPSLSSLRGLAAGRIKLEPVTGEHALGPLRLTADIEPVNSQIQQVNLGKISTEIYLGNDRLLLNRLEIAAARGVLTLWGRVSRHDDQWFGFAQGQWHDLSFDQLASLMHLFEKPKASAVATAPTTVSATQTAIHSTTTPAPAQPPIPGLFDGKAYVTGPVFDWTKASGHGEVIVRDSDLVRVPIFNELYGILNVAGGREKPQGFGRAEFRLEGPSFILTNAAYVNRGMSVNLRLRADDLRLGLQSPLRGLAVAIFNPLPQLPGIQRYVDAIMSYQGKGTTLAISGTMENRVLQRVPSTFIGKLTREMFKSPAAPATQPATLPTTRPDTQSTMETHAQPSIP